MLSISGGLAQASPALGGEHLHRVVVRTRKSVVQDGTDDDHPEP